MRGLALPEVRREGRDMPGKKGTGKRGGRPEDAAGAAPARAPCCGEPPEEGGTPESLCCPPGSWPAESFAGTPERRPLDVEFMYIDLNLCARCRGTEASLEEAAAEIAGLLEEMGVDLRIYKIHVRSEAEARELGFAISPTVRINGRDIQPDAPQTICDACTGLAGCEMECRVWTFRGKEYPAPPRAMIIDAILREVYGGPREGPESPPPPAEIPEALKRFFDVRRRKVAGGVE